MNDASVISNSFEINEALVSAPTFAASSRLAFSASSSLAFSAAWRSAFCRGRILSTNVDKQRSQLPENDFEKGGRSTIISPLFEDLQISREDSHKQQGTISFGRVE